MASDFLGVIDDKLGVLGKITLPLIGFLFVLKYIFDFGFTIGFGF